MDGNRFQETRMHGGMGGMAKTITERALAAMLRPMPPASFPLGRGWFVACNMSRQEREIENDVRRLGFEVFCPMETRAKRVRGRRRDVREPLLPGYMFVSFDRERDDWPAILDVDGVLDILQNGQLPVRVPDIDIERLRNAEQNGLFDFTKALQPGQAVEITEGPFAGLIGNVRKASANKRASVLLEALGAIDVDPTFLRKI